MQEPKDDRRDALTWAQELRTGAIEKSVNKAPDRFALLRQLALSYDMVMRDVVQTQLQAVAKERTTRWFEVGVASASDPSRFLSQGVRCWFISSNRPICPRFWPLWLVKARIENVRPARNTG
jgi:hypothetical protein